MARTLATTRTLLTKAYIPTDLPGCLIWLKADGLSLADGALVDSWTDFSGNNYHASSGSLASRPTYETNEINGLPVVRFSGSQGRQFSSGDSAQFAIPNYTLLAVAKRTSGTTILGKCTTGASDGRRRKIQMQLSGTTLTFAAGSDGVGISLAATTTSFNVYGVVARANNDHDLILNGTATNFTTLLDDTSMNASLVEVGQAFSNGAERLNGDIAEIIMFDRALSVNEWSGLFSYLGTKYAITQAAFGTPSRSLATRTLATSRTLIS